MDNKNMRDYSIEFRTEIDPLCRKWYGSISGLKNEFPDAKIISKTKLKGQY